MASGRENLWREAFIALAVTVGGIIVTIATGNLHIGSGARQGMSGVIAQPSTSITASPGATSVVIPMSPIAASATPTPGQVDLSGNETTAAIPTAAPPIAPPAMSVPLSALCSTFSQNCNAEDEQADGEIFQSVIDRDVTNYPAFTDVFDATALATCSKLSISFAGLNETGMSETGDMAYIKVVQSNAAPITRSASVGHVLTFTADLNGGPVSIDVATTFGQNDSVNTGTGDVVVLNGHATCTSATGM